MMKYKTYFSPQAAINNSVNASFKTMKTTTRVKERVGGVTSQFVGQRIEGECREDKAAGRWRSTVKAL